MHNSPSLKLGGGGTKRKKYHYTFLKSALLHYNWSKDRKQFKLNLPSRTWTNKNTI